MRIFPTSRVREMPRDWFAIDWRVWRLQSRQDGRAPAPLPSVQYKNLSAVGGNNLAPGQADTGRSARLVLPHLGVAYSLARWITGNRADAEDVVQDACLRAFRAIGSVGDGSARPWVLTVVRNTAYTWLRKNRPSAILAVEDLEVVETANAKPGDPDSETPETAVIARADAAALQAAIMALPTAYPETKILRDVQGLSYRG